MASVNPTEELIDSPLAPVLHHSAKDKHHVSTKETAYDSSDSISTLSENPFSDPDIKDHWVRVYEGAQYECRHIFDADASWTEEEEKKVIRKLDWRGMHLDRYQRISC